MITSEKKEKLVSKEFKEKRKVKVNPFRDYLSKLKKNLNHHKRTLKLIGKLDAAFKRNLKNNFEKDSLCEIKLSLIKKSFSNKETQLTKKQINAILAQKILKALQIEKTPKFIGESYLNKIDLNSYTKIRNSIINFLTEDIKETLFNIVLQSKTSDLVNLAASNAITLLNKSEFSFRDKDLSKISIPNADLSWGLFINTNFESSNLYGVNFSNSNLYDSNFRDCNMMNVNFGEILNFCFEKRDYIQCSPCGRIILVYSKGITRLYSARTYQEIFQVSNIRPVMDLLLSDDENYLSIYTNGYTYLYDVSSKFQIAKIKKEKPCSFSPCSRYLCFTLKPIGYDRIAKIYCIKAKQIVNEIDFLDHPIIYATFSPLGEKLIASSHDTLSIYNLSKNEEIIKIRFRSTYNIVFSFNRKYFIIYRWDYKNIIYSVENLDPITCLRGYSSVVFSLSGRYLALQKLSFWEIVDLWKLNKKIKIPLQSFKVFSIKEKYAFMLRDKNLTSLALKPRGQGNRHFLSNFKISTISFSHDSKFFAVLTYNGRIFIFFIENQKFFKKIKATGPYMRNPIAWSDTVWAVAYENAIKIWNIYDESLLKVISVNGKYNIKFSTDQKRIAMFGTSFIDIIDIDSEMIILRLDAHGWSITDLSITGWAWHHCGNFVPVMLNENNEIIWNADIQKILIENKGVEEGSLVSISHSEKNTILIGKSKLIKAWYLEDRGKDRKDIRKIKEFSSHYRITILMWSPDGKNIIACGKKGDIIVWDYSSGKIIKKIAAKKEIGLIDVSTRGNLISTIHYYCGKLAKIWKF